MSLSFRRKLASIEKVEDTLVLKGDLNVFNAMSIYVKSLMYLKELNELQIDFAELKASDSVGLALIIEWMKYAKQNKKTIRFLHLSRNLLAIAKAAGIEEIIT
jgi:phospholipid transport system transporter-binding protein